MNPKQKWIQNSSKVGLKWNPKSMESKESKEEVYKDQKAN